MFYKHNNNYTVESVTSGHPDKICDQISDAILDAYITLDLKSRVAVETFGGHGKLVIGGEVTSKGKVDYVKIAREVYKEIGYNDELEISAHIVTQSPDIAMGVDTGGAGDQGIMYGYATDEVPEFLPKGIVLAHKLAKRLERARKNTNESERIKWLRPDGKTQVTYANGKLQTVLVSAQHSPDVKLEEIKKEITEKIINPLLSEEEKKTVKILVNPTGQFIQGGFEADTGLTGRKLMVDTYGGIIPHGGGCFSGKDATKVDRSGAYMARFVAKNLVASGYGKEVLVSVAYAIGMAEPLMIEAINEKGEDLAEIVRKNFDFKPLAIIKRLDLRTPIFRKTATYGHFGRKNMPWERIEKIN
ncbi:MAG: S-adenosylmethionine synthase [Candidatus Nomurabacteria bacterium GW2011_GWC2_41_8]|uniref:Methionine adenosyltransferase n=2 Tax=Candidatus Nomuraibacteriota TaxID=1752729 RepID=A0A1F6YDJ2_9BACT|nr:MAG: S-adenosylmethionine synthase [Candidatus Nomurabacteria bacterium GW2011_GWC2_41_8]OGI67068.1 MAG: methionine adenosyltransferase [Candidatus Nomurabacteria bacterium RIFCSPHIGHO2_01_FULL_41_91]OGI80111.1 MAG: methionine adenosyltransferase [Candidatus Nomurabacteria bacterium RIFCSPHIGHO2_02_FULL_41_52]OGI84470.1 MAG: methionine adenosyltransferase [Candidatus Nomurabacteria bacterium RIFCSPHIGHO2_12_FULL_42_19]OGI93685.1 MAG: methionine adenosyltransferase [Candidatus Nomurabacteria 